ncbi:unnamed protein product [Cuscuta campestris]|uniref:Uncharacterized protein n=1 Tax=Cuscuta campestris TaxID=132261 RepID=A0A484MA18_9ASTE|nr:unnamed protein product [Cuscuta campestris]
MASSQISSPSSVTRACHPSGGYEVVERWAGLEGWTEEYIIWAALAKLGFGPRFLYGSMGVWSVKMEGNA